VLALSAAVLCASDAATDKLLLSDAFILSEFDALLPVSLSVTCSRELLADSDADTDPDVSADALRLADSAAADSLAALDPSASLADTDAENAADSLAETDNLTDSADSATLSAIS
jgi:hypothetical protein